MTATQIVILVLVLLVVAAVVAAVMAQANKRKRLQSRFGPEYDRTVEERGRRRDAERELAEREERRRSLDIRPLPEQDRLMYTEKWRTTQGDFVDHPELAVRQADLLVAEVMGRRGYPIGDFDQMSRDVSVDHADTVSEYRAAHEISDLNDRKQASTEQLRQAMVHYRALFNDLLASDESSGDDSSRHTPDGVRDERAYDERTSVRDERAHDGGLRDGGLRDERAHDGGLHDGGVRDERLRDGVDDDDRGTVRGGAGDPGYATDQDRRHEPIDTGRDGVRVERGGRERGLGDTDFERDVPRDERPRA